MLQEAPAEVNESAQQSPSDEDIDTVATPIVTKDKKDKKTKEKKEKPKKEKPPKEKKEKAPKKEKPPKEPKAPKPVKQPTPGVRSSRMVLCRVQLLDNTDVEVEVDVSVLN